MSLISATLSFFFPSSCHHYESSATLECFSSSSLALLRFRRRTWATAVLAHFNSYRVVPFFQCAHCIFKFSSTSSCLVLSCLHRVRGHCTSPGTRHFWFHLLHFSHHAFHYHVLMTRMASGALCGGHKLLLGPPHCPTATGIWQRFLFVFSIISIMHYVRAWKHHSALQAPTSNFDLSCRRQCRTDLLVSIEGTTLCLHAIFLRCPSHLP